MLTASLSAFDPNRRFLALAISVKCVFMTHWSEHSAPDQSQRCLGVKSWSPPRRR